MKVHNISSIALRMASFGILAAVAATASACSSSPEPAANDGGGGGDSGGGATFTQVYTTILGATNGCNSLCHSAANASSFGNLDMSTQALAFTNLVNVTAKGTQSTPTCASANVKRVIPGDPTNSLLYSKVSSASPLCGVQMPQGGPYLAAAQMDMIRSWIQAGAQND